MIIISAEGKHDIQAHRNALKYDTEKINQTEQEVNRQNIICFLG